MTEQRKNDLYQFLNSCINEPIILVAHKVIESGFTFAELNEIYTEGVYCW